MKVSAAAGVANRACALQFMPPTHPALLLRLERQAARYGARLVLDLEDAIQDPLEPERTPTLKAAARARIREFCLSRPTTHGGLSIRINPLGTRELERDLALLRELSSGVRWERIVVPKVDQGAMAREFESLLKANGVVWHELVPTIETVAGVRHLDDLLDGVGGTSVRTVQFGHYDYNLDAGHWPFLDQHSEALWEIVTSISRRVESAELQYSHSPHGDLEDDDGLRRILVRLHGLCRRAFSMATLTAAQSRVCGEPRLAVESIAARPAEELAHGRKLEMAHHTMAAYRSGRCSDRSFAVARDHARFVSPHEYWGASNYLRQQGAGDG